MLSKQFRIFIGTAVRLGWNDPLPVRPQLRVQTQHDRHIRAVDVAIENPDAAAEPGDELLRWISFSGDPIEVPRWTLIVQSVHHATEHRAQIAAALAAQLGAAGLTIPGGN